MDRLRTFLQRWGGPLGIFTALLALGWNYSTGNSVAADSSNQAVQRSVGWVVTVVIFIFIGWFLYAFTSIFPGKDWKERTTEDGVPRGVVWERRTLMVSFSYMFTILFLLFPLWSRALIHLDSTQKYEFEIPIAFVVGCAVPSIEDPAATTKKDDLKSVPKELRCGANTDQWVMNIGGKIVKLVEPSVLNDHFKSGH